jgi:uncharacterized protein YjlB
MTSKSATSKSAIGKPAAAPEAVTFADDGRFPNSSLPLLVYRGALPADPATMERRFAAHGWSGGWRDGIFPFHHFHSTAHEVLGIAAGSAEVRFGGPQGRTVAVQAGDVVVIPAGVAHCRERASSDLLVVGAYPGGTDYDTRRGDPGEHAEVLRNIARVGRPEQDPVQGGEGALLRLWGGTQA